MGIFDQKRGMNQWGVPAIYDEQSAMGQQGIPGASDRPYQFDPQMPRMATPEMPKPGFFGKGGTGQYMLGYGLGALAQQLGGSNPYEAQMTDDRELQHQQALLRMKAELDGNDPQAMNLGDGGVATWSRNGGLNVLREPTPTQHTDPLQQKVDYIRKLNPSLTDAQAAQLAQNIALGGNSEQAYNYKRQLKQVTPGKAPSSAYHAPHYEYRTNPQTGQIERRRIG